MRGIVIYAAVAAPFLLLEMALLGLGVSAETSLSATLLAAIVAAVISTIYVRRIFLATPVPRAIFFGMLVSALEVKVAFGVWIGYLVAASLLLPVSIILPLPSSAARSAITGVAAIILLISAVYYAVTIKLESRRER